MKEHEIEKKLIEILTVEQNQWTYRPDLKTETDLWNNLRGHINRINKRVLADVPLTTSEFMNLQSRFKAETATPFKASQWLRGENGIAALTIEREDTSKGKITLDVFSNKDICGGISSYEVVNQISPDADYDMRGDVTLLINGLPIVHIELKAEYAKSGYMQAFEQIKRYAKSGYFNGIYGATQIFVISNKVATKYFARPASNEETAFEAMRGFLFNWRTPENENIDELFEFAKQVLTIPMAHELVSKFSILVDDKKKQKFLMVLRPYQIHAIKKIQRAASERPLDGKGGFIWHATGSGKTITSFVATKLLARNGNGVARTVMVVDRTDLDTQTKDEFSKFASEYNTGSAKDKEKMNTLIVEINNQKEFKDNLLSKTNNNTIIITTIQKISAAIRKAKASERNKFEKLKGEHIVFIVDECHRAVSDEQMKEIKKLLPKSTWFGLTGTPILEPNQKQENGTFARTTYQQYGDKLHAYTTKNAMDDKSVLGFQVEYFSTIKKDSEEAFYHATLQAKSPNKDSDEILKNMTDLQKEALINHDHYDSDEHIEAMLLKIFKRSNVVTKFKIKDGYPTMSGILTTQSIEQAKKIYNKLQAMKKNGTLLNGNFTSVRHGIEDTNFPRVAITYSLSDEQNGMIERQKELTKIISDYSEMFYGKPDAITDIKKFNRNVNKRLERKESQYQENGQWLDLVIVVDRLLTGFDAPTIQTLYVDRELKYQKLLQAFSRTNRTLKGKDVGMIVTFRKPETMKQNVADSIKLFSDDDPNWETLNSKPYNEVLQDFKELYAKYEEAEMTLHDKPHDIKAKIEQVKAFNRLTKAHKALISYDEYNDPKTGELADFQKLAPLIDTLPSKGAVCENLESEIKEQTKNEFSEDAVNLLQEVEFTDQRDAAAKEDIDSFYIKTLLDEAISGDVEAAGKFREEIVDKPQQVKTVYEEMLAGNTPHAYGTVQEARMGYFTNAIDAKIGDIASELMIPFELLKKSYLVYDANKEEVPHISEITEEMKRNWRKEAFELHFGGKYRSMPKVISAYWKKIIQEEILPLKGEL